MPIFWAAFMMSPSCPRPAARESKPASTLWCLAGCAAACLGAKWSLLALVLGLGLTSRGMAAGIEDVSVPFPGIRHGTLPILGDDELLIEEVFQSHLPTTLEKGTLRFSLHPHLGDYVRKDNMRLTTGLRYGLTENCEVSLGSNLFFSHGNGEVRSFEDYGAANLRLGTKYDLGEVLFRGCITAVGVDYEFPVGRPPAELTDGLRHLRPYVTFSHRLESHPDVRIFLGFRLDAVTHTHQPGELGKNAFNSSSTGITGGLVIDRHAWHYTFEASVDTTRLIGQGQEEVITFRPGVLYEIPNRRHPERRSLWLVGVAVNSAYGPGGSSLGASFKLRYSRDIKNRHLRAPFASTK